MKIGNIECYGIIYKITNKINKKVYIGQTIRSFEERYYFNGEGIERVYKYHLSAKNRGLSYNKHLLEAIEKYGFEAFEITTIYDIAFSKDELNIKEKHYIRLFDSFIDGYNNTLGGEGIKGHNPYKDKTDEEILEWRRKNSEALKGRFVSDESKKKRSKTLMGHSVSEETKKKISEKAKLRTGKDSSRAKSVICLTTEKVFFTTKEGGEYYGINNTGIVMCCNGKRKSAGKINGKTPLKWIYLDKFLSLCELISL